ncbi:hypothetical protein QIS96_21045 [Streptomyces sp. B-S-A6]|uniref:Uncharacterized protein n=1 Tax=Streptomyces cavernicola TaxID=3043613 RepID=A0ABT6SDP1_9ACTN|nr:hypothetical protein [Streptomyces sp. B-S-A6]MDI3406285.1 hypothetical protein [Streptomyces sp. B-S-A6]
MVGPNVPDQETLPALARALGRDLGASFPARGSRISWIFAATWVSVPVPDGGGHRHEERWSRTGCGEGRPAAEGEVPPGAGRGVRRDRGRAEACKTGPSPRRAARRSRPARSNPALSQRRSRSC